MTDKPRPRVCRFDTDRAGVTLSWKAEYTASKLPREVEQGGPPDAVEVEADAAELTAVDGVILRHLQPEADVIEDECLRHFQRMTEMYRDE